MSIREFIKRNKRQLDIVVCSRPGMDGKKPVDERDYELWILNDEGLYRWAQSEGVNI